MKVLNMSESYMKDKNMTIITAHGYSDDVAVVTVDGKTHEYSVDNSYGWVGVIEDTDGNSALLYVDYRLNGCWTVTVGQEREGAPVPTDWEVSHSWIYEEAPVLLGEHIPPIPHTKEYSAGLTIKIPRSASLRDY